MKYLRLLLTFLFGIGFFFVGYSILKLFNVGITHIDLLSKPIAMLLIISSLPFVGTVFNSRKVRISDKTGIKFNSVSLECSFHKTIELGKKELREIVKDCYNSTLFRDRVLNLTYEDENEIVYHIETRRREIEKKMDRAQVNDYDIIINDVELDGKTELNVLSKNIYWWVFSNNRENEEHIKVLVDRLKNEKLI